MTSVQMSNKEPEDMITYVPHICSLLSQCTQECTYQWLVLTYPFLCIFSWTSHMWPFAVVLNSEIPSTSSIWLLYVMPD